MKIYRGKKAKTPKKRVWFEIFSKENVIKFIRIAGR